MTNTMNGFDQWWKETFGPPNDQYAKAARAGWNARNAYIKTLEDALRFYADETTYLARQSGHKYTLAPIVIDKHGAKAREALEPQSAKARLDESPTSQPNSQNE